MKWRVAGLIAVCVLIVAIGAPLLAVRVTDQLSEKEAVILIRDSIVRSCEKNGNTLRKALVQNIEDQIQRTKGNVKLTIKFFPSIPPATLRNLTQDQIDSLREQQRRVGPINCPVQFPLP